MYLIIGKNLFPIVKILVINFPLWIQTFEPNSNTESNHVTTALINFSQVSKQLKNNLSS